MFFHRYFIIFTHILLIDKVSKFVAGKAEKESAPRNADDDAVEDVDMSIVRTPNF